jgi:hypothetical protein
MVADADQQMRVKRPCLNPEVDIPQSEARPVMSTKTTGMASAGLPDRHESQTIGTVLILPTNVDIHTTIPERESYAELEFPPNRNGAADNAKPRGQGGASLFARKDDELLFGTAKRGDSVHISEPKRHPARSEPAGSIGPVVPAKAREARNAHETLSGNDFGGGHAGGSRSSRLSAGDRLTPPHFNGDLKLDVSWPETAWPDDNPLLTSRFSMHDWAAMLGRLAENRIARGQVLRHSRQNSE